MGKLLSDIDWRGLPEKEWGSRVYKCINALSGIENPEEWVKAVRGLIEIAKVEAEESDFSQVRTIFEEALTAITKAERP